MKLFGVGHVRISRLANGADVEPAGRNEIPGLAPAHIDSIGAELEEIAACVDGGAGVRGIIFRNGVFRGFVGLTQYRGKCPCIGYLQRRHVQQPF
jgi:hypothetical protein